MIIKRGMAEIVQVLSEDEENNKLSWKKVLKDKVKKEVFKESEKVNKIGEK